MSLAKLVLLLNAVLFFGSCSLDDVSKSDDLNGTYVLQQYRGDTVIYSRESDLAQDERGVAFGKANRITFRGNFSGCGTPPIVYTNLEGRWRRQSENYIRVSFESWMGQTVVGWELTETGDSLKIIEHR